MAPAHTKIMRIGQENLGSILIFLARGISVPITRWPHMLLYRCTHAGKYCSSVWNSRYKTKKRFWSRPTVTEGQLLQ